VNNCGTMGNYIILKYRDGIIVDEQRLVEFKEKVKNYLELTGVKWFNGWSW